MRYDLALVFALFIAAVFVAILRDAAARRENRSALIAERARAVAAKAHGKASGHEGLAAHLRSAVSSARGPARILGTDLTRFVWR